MQRDKFLGVAIIIAGTLVAAGVAFASIPGPDGTIAGCYLKSGGRLRVIDKQAGQKCTSKEVAISLSQQGPPGGDGADGSPGPQGLPGEEGPPGPTAITDRIRLASPPFVPGVESPVDVPFSAAEWTQRAGTLNTLLRTSHGHQRRCAPPRPGDGERRFQDRWSPGRLDGSFNVAEQGTRSFDFGFVNKQALEPFVQVLFEPASDTNHTLSAVARSTCAHTKFEEISVDVVEIA